MSESQAVQALLSNEGDYVVAYASVVALFVNSYRLRPPVSAPFRWTSEVRFSFYLLQIPLIAVGEDHFTPLTALGAAKFALVTTGLVFAMSEFRYDTIEKHTVKLGKSVRRSPRCSPGTVVEVDK